MKTTITEKTISCTIFHFIWSWRLLVEAEKKQISTQRRKRKKKDNIVGDDR